MDSGQNSFLTDLSPQELWTGDVPASWLSVELDNFRVIQLQLPITNKQVLPTTYTLRHGGNYKADSLRNWDFQGSNDGKNWHTLRRFGKLQTDEC